MAVSKRTRFEVLRRDDYTCRYCRSKDNELTIDHVVPVALGGTDAPANLVAACRDCNFGKASSSPDAELAAQVDQDAVRWAAAMRLAQQRAADQRERERAALEAFRDVLWGQWSDNDGNPFPLPDDWGPAVMRQLNNGLDADDIIDAIQATMERVHIRRADRFRYFLGVCKHMLIQRMDAARKIIADGGADAS